MSITLENFLSSSHFTKLKACSPTYEIALEALQALLHHETDVHSTRYTRKNRLAQNCEPIAIHCA
jgi:hypothetical protein